MAQLIRRGIHQLLQSPSQTGLRHQGVDLISATGEYISGSAILDVLERIQFQLYHPNNRWSSSLPAQEEADDSALSKVRNIGISAHIDSGKTTLTERILFYTGKIHAIHEVRGKDGVGAKMDSMDLEREKGITIQSAATYCKWNDTQINIIDTPGHVDFTIEVERALRVLDGAILVLCSVGGVQSQSITVDRQMRRYDVPRLAFINKLDRAGAEPFRVINQLREKLRLNAAAVQYPIGLEDAHAGVVDLVSMKAVSFTGSSGENVEIKNIPSHLMAKCDEARNSLIEQIADVDDEIGELYLMEEDISESMLREAIRRSTISLDFVPIFMGSAFKNKGVQLLLDGVTNYLPCPTDVKNEAIDLNNNEEKILLPCDANKPLVALAFKLEEGKFGQLTYVRIYSGSLRKGEMITNLSSGKKIKVPRLVRMHSDELEDVQEALAGDIVAMFGVDCSSGDTFTDGTVRYAMTSMNVPDPVMSLAVAPQARDQSANFSKALNRFQKEDPTFQVSQDKESGETIISGMGELHLEIYVERMKREYKVECDVGRPRVNYREAITKRTDFDYLHKKQSGGQGQYGRVVGYIEPLPSGSSEKFVFENAIVGNAIPPNFIPAVQKGFEEVVNAGSLIGHPVEGVKIVLTDGAAHAVDSSEMAFKLAAMYAFRTAYPNANPTILEPVMTVEIIVPSEFQGTVIGDINRRKGVVVSSDQEGDDVTVICHVPLNEMFGYSSSLRSFTQGKGEFSMDYLNHSPLPADALKNLISQSK
jgi:elongation factor G